MLLDFPSRLSSRNRNFLNFKNCVKAKIELTASTLQAKFPIWILKELIYDRLATLLRTAVVCDLILRDIKYFFVVGGKKINPILLRRKSSFTA
jgi:hypothetical protein